MAMIVQHNITSMNANRQLGISTSALAKSTEKLSSGYRINRAADDAAGLAISEKMRSQIRGLEQASTNASDGISMIQTAEGALQESHSILQRMRELAVQAANGTETDDDRGNIQDEIEQLQEELDRIASDTEFNTRKLLDGSLSSGSTNMTDAGPKYGVYDGELGAFITSSVSGVVVKSTVDASVGGESAIWSADGKTLTLNLAKNATYSQVEIDKMIENAKQEDSGATNSPADVTVKFATGVYTANAATNTLGNLTTSASSKASSDEYKAIYNTTVGAGDVFTSGNIEIKIASPQEEITDIEFKTDATVGTAASASYDGSGKLTITLKTGTTYTNADLQKLLDTCVDKNGDPCGFVLNTSDDLVTGADDAKTQTIATADIDEITSGIITTDTTQYIGANEIKLSSNRYGIDQNIWIQVDFNASIGGEKAEAVTLPEYDMTASGDDAVAGQGVYKLSLASGTEYTSADIEKILAQAGIDVKVELSGNEDNNGTDEPNTLFVTDKNITLDLVMGGGKGLGDEDAFFSQTNYGNSAGSGGITLQVGANEGQTLTFSIDDMSSASLGVNGSKVDCSTQTGASNSIGRIDDAIQLVSKQRSLLGAVQNRLEHTISNLDNTAENLQDAESSIRDVDMASEMVTYSKYNILQQAGQSMLAQANQSTQGVLSLLQG